MSDPGRPLERRGPSAGGGAGAGGGARQPGTLSRYIGGRLVAYGRVLKYLALVVLALAGVKAYLAYHRHEHVGAIIAGVVGAAVALALVSVGVSRTAKGVVF